MDLSKGRNTILGFGVVPFYLKQVKNLKCNHRFTTDDTFKVKCYFMQPNVGHFGHGHFGLGRFGPDISATDVSATENAKGGRFGQNHKLWVGVRACINV